MNTDQTPLAARLTVILAGRSVNSIALASGVPQPTLSKMMRRASYSERAADLRKLATALDLPPSCLLTSIADSMSDDLGGFAGNLIAIAKVLSVDVGELLPVAD